MTLTLAELQSIQADAMADDVEIDLPRMASWTVEEATAFFESGGLEAPDRLSPEQVRALGATDGAVIAQLASKLPALGPSQPSMPGEERGAKQASKCFVPKADARVRLFCLYGVADSAMSIEPWIRGAPEWLEVRLVDFPGECACNRATPLHLRRLHLTAGADALPCAVW